MLPHIQEASSLYSRVCKITILRRMVSGQLLELILYFLALFSAIAIDPVSVAGDTFFKSDGGVKPMMEDAHVVNEAVPECMRQNRAV